LEPVLTRDQQPSPVPARRVPDVRRLLPYLVNRLFGAFSSVSTEPFLDPAQFPWTPLLEQHYPAIRAEVDTVLNVRAALPNFQDIAPNLIRLSDDDQWKTFWFVGYGIWDDPNCLRCPRTAAVLRAVPGLTTAFFSILGPGKRLPAHYGPYRGVLRHHLALVVPEPAGLSGIKVGNQTRHWAEGHSLVFDDTYEHEAWNDTDRDRVVLFIDVVRPLRPPLSWLNTLVLWAVPRSGFIKAARAQHVQREAVFTAAWDAHEQAGPLGGLANASRPQP